MDIKITGKHVEISSEIKSFIEKEFSKLEKFEKNIMNSKVIVSLNDKRYHVEMVISAKKHTFTSSDESFELMTSLDNAFNKLKKQLIKFEKKIHEHNTGKFQ